MSGAPQLTQFYTDFINDIDNDMKGFQPLDILAKKVKLRPGHIVLIIVGIVIFFTMIGLLQHIFVTIFGMLYPAYMSFKAMQEIRDDNRKKWLTYWIVFGFVTAFDKLLNFILFFLPAYYTLKAIFYIWMFYPKTNGAGIMYQKFLKPQLTKMNEILKKYNN